METIISRATQEVVIGHGRPTVLVGERINPTGKKRLAEALRAGDLDVVREEALKQQEAGADIIDVNVSTFGVDDVKMLPEAVQAVMDAVQVPLCLDCTNRDAIAAALKVYDGKPLINSVSGEEKSLAEMLPLVKEHGAAVVGLVQDDEGIPKDTERRVAIAHKIVERAESAGIRREDVVIDCLALSIGADTESGPAVLDAIRRVKADLGVNLILGASNVSFGLPDRDILNNAFVSAAIVSGVNCLIVDAAKVGPTVLATDLVLGCDKYARRYIEGYRRRRM